MWSDNETSEDLLGFKVQADLLIDVIKKYVETKLGKVDSIRHKKHIKRNNGYAKIIFSFYKAFEVEVLKNNIWQKIAVGTTIGYKRIVKRM